MVVRKAMVFRASYYQATAPRRRSDLSLALQALDDLAHAHRPTARRSVSIRSAWRSFIGHRLDQRVGL